MHYPFKVIKLPYTFSSLEPQFSSDTLLYHYKMHYETYVDQLNSILAKFPSMQLLTLEELIVYIEKIDSPLKNELLTAAGGVYNHQLYFKCLDPAHFSPPRSQLSYAICRDFGSFLTFKELFLKQALTLTGSGYIWLIDNNGRLEIISTPNQDTPLSYSVTPIFLIDLWEHAYYLQYKNNRKEYLDNVFMILNWKYIEKRFCYTL